MSHRPTCTLYAIRLSVAPTLQLDPPSRLAEAHKRIYCAAFVTVVEAVDGFNRALRMGAWPMDAEPEVRDLRDGSVIYFRTHTGAWEVPRPLVEYDDLTGH